ncbi:MAG: TIGR02147 family protein [Chitinivibrionales bacterium]|nr:TIGR02147 family protein [Chitinivibrionales bacterium]
MVFFRSGGVTYGVCVRLYRFPRIPRRLLPRAQGETPLVLLPVSRRAGGFPQQGHLYNIIHGAKGLSKAATFRLSKALKHNRYEAEYFELLVAFNQAANLEERTELFERMQGVKHAGVPTSPAQRIRRDQYDFYSKWYYGAVWSLVDLYGFSGDYAWLASSLEPAITVKQAREAVTLLERLELLSKRADGSYKTTRKTLTTGPEVKSLAVLNLHLDMMKLAASAVKTLPRDRRNVTGVLLGISEETYTRICEETYQFQERIMALAEQDRKADRVYQFNFHLFPLSKTDRNDRRRS